MHTCMHACMHGYKEGLAVLARTARYHNNDFEVTVWSLAGSGWALCPSRRESGSPTWELLQHPIFADGGRREIGLVLLMPAAHFGYHQRVIQNSSEGWLFR